ncbi:hypothetical protein [Lentilactobacillus kisonensis]|uniref:hypothetical protein n=1 Tax=Lentilactobacillus kisonensis TaxID=481722 RepID=UPI000AE08342|nr:hypothetical protein [Lentilactobacillus kisonensis]
MNLSTFTELIEFKILGASAFPFSVGLFFSWYFLNSVNGLYAALFFIAMILFDAAVNVMDNYNDFHHSDAEEYKSKTNIVGRANISATFLNSLLVALIGPSAAIGLYLTTKVGYHYFGWGCFALRSACCIQPVHTRFLAHHLVN